MRFAYFFCSEIHSNLHFTTFLLGFWKEFALALHVRPEESVLRARFAGLEEKRLSQDLSMQARVALGAEGHSE